MRSSPYTGWVRRRINRIFSSTLSHIQWPSCHQTQSRCTCRLLKYQRTTLRKSRSTGKWMHRRVFSRHWGDCLCRWRQTTFHSWRTWGWEHNFREDEAGTCQAELYGELQHCCSPSRQRASPQWDTIRDRISDCWSRVAGAVFPLWGPTSGLCCLTPQSRAWCRRQRYRCSWPRRCDPGTVWPESGYEDPTQQCSRRWKKAR